MSAVLWKPKAGVREDAARVLPALAQRYFEAGDLVAAGGTAPEELHRFRLKTKHFRYTLELFEELYGARFRALLESLKPLQNLLGEINDAATALSWLGAGEALEIRDALEQRIARKTAEFEACWRAGQRERWVTVLEKPLASVPAIGRDRVRR